MAKIKLYLDEDIFQNLAPVLRSRGYDVVSVYEVDMRGKSDSEQLEWAITQNRTLVSFNARHYAILAETFYQENTPHFGILVSPQVGFSELLQLLLNVLVQATPDQLYNTLQWLQSYR